MLDNVGLRYPHRASVAKAPRTLRPLPLLRFAVSATGGAHLAASSIICAFGLASAAPRLPYRHLELCGIALIFQKFFHRSSQRIVPEKTSCGRRGLRTKSGGQFIACKVSRRRRLAGYRLSCWPQAKKQAGHGARSVAEFLHQVKQIILWRHNAVRENCLIFMPAAELGAVRPGFPPPRKNRRTRRTAAAQ